MHNIPTIILLIGLIISWRHEIVGGIGFILAGILYIISILIKTIATGFEWYHLIWIIQISGIAFFIGILFLVCWFKKKIICIGWFWKFIYTFWPSVLRSYEIFFHHHRRRFLIGHLASQKTVENLKKHLTKHNFKRAIIALKDPGEILNMRKREGKEFQYHIRLFNDKEIRVHYEYAPEAHPITHCFSVRQESKEKYFKQLLKRYLK